MGLARQEYWSGLPFPPPGDPPNPGIKPKFLTSPALAGGFFTTSATWEAQSESVSVVTLLPLGYIFHGILEARILERESVLFSR